MVKGISRRVILVKSPDPRLFEEAIFIVREEALSGGGVNADQVLQEAQKVARGYTRRTAPLERALQKGRGACWPRRAGWPGSGCEYAPHLRAEAEGIIIVSVRPRPRARSIPAGRAGHLRKTR